MNSIERERNGQTSCWFRILAERSAGLAVGGSTRDGSVRGTCVRNYGNRPAFALALDHGDDYSAKLVCYSGGRESIDSQFVPVPDNSSYPPLHRVSALVAHVAQQHVRPLLAFLQRHIGIALGQLDAASIPLEHGPGSDYR